MRIPIQNRRESQKGMTLAEVLVASAIFAIIFVAALMIYDRSNRVFKTGVENADLQQNTRIAFDKMLSDIRMAGYDYDRDGIPTAAGEAQQQDEQIEYAGQRALTLRANLDHGDLAQGRETALEIPNSQFPIVTTGNDEIITYALVSDNGANPDTITFYADVTDGSVAARQTFPSGEVEDTITISGVDLCASGTCDDPPYTLMRFTLDDEGQPVRTPLATNIRTMELNYFSDAAGSTPLVIADAGGGQYNPANPMASLLPRAARAQIRAVDVVVVGMTDAPAQDYVDGNEPLDTAPKDFTRYRKYRLETLVAPRNLGKRGLKEQQTAPPGPPTLDSVCFGYCGAARVNWTAPPKNALYGSVETYVILWDTDIAATDPPLNAQQVGLTTTFVLTGIDPNTAYRFTVAASNSWGTTYSNQFVVGTPKNQTTPDPPANLVGTKDPSPLTGQIDLSWDLPTTNVSGQDTVSCLTPGGGTSSQVVGPEQAEMRGIEIWRSSDPNFDPLASPLPSTTVQVTETTGANNVFSDLTAPNCIQQYYRIRVVEYCIADPANQNIAPAVAYSEFEPPVGTPAAEGKSVSTAVPAAPTGMNVMASSACVSPSCNVDLEWPEVKLDDAGNPLGIGVYDVDVTQNGAPYTTYNNLDLSSGLSLAAGIVSYSVLNLPEADLISGLPYEYHFTARAVNCSIPGDWSPSDKFPKCTFAGGGVLIPSVSGALSGDGSAANPFEVETTGAIGFTTSTSALLDSVTATAYNAATNAPLGWTDGAIGPNTVLSVGWPGGSDDVVYRIDYKVTDTLLCERTGSIYIKDVQIGCPFVVPTTFGLKLVNGGNNNDPPHVDVQLKNNTAFQINVTKLEFDWSQAASGTTKDVDLDNNPPVFFPVPPNNFQAATSWTGSLLIPGTVVATGPGSTSDLAPNDLSGNYRMRVVFQVQANDNLGANPITGVTIHYRLTTDPVAEPDRTCTVYP